MQCQVYFEASIHQELQQIGFFNDLLVMFDDKQVYLGYEQQTKACGKLNILRASHIISEFEENIRLRLLKEIQQQEIIKLQSEIRTVVQQSRIDQHISIELASQEILQFQDCLKTQEAQEKKYVQKLEKLRNQKFELKYQIENNKEQFTRSDQDQKEISKMNVIKDLSEKNTKLKTNILRLENETKQLKDKVTQEMKKFNYKNEKYQILSKKFQQMEQLKNAQDDEISQLKKQNVQLQKGNQQQAFLELNKTQGSSQNSFIRIQTLTEDLNKQIEQLNEALVVERRQRDEEVETLHSQAEENSKLNKEIFDLKQINKNYKLMLEIKQEDLEKLSEEKSVLEALIESKEELIQKYLIDAVNQEEKLNNVIKKSNTIVQQLKNQINVCETTLQQQQQEQLKSKNSLILEYKQRIDELKSNKASIQDVGKLQNRLSLEQQEKKDLEQSMISVKKSLNIGFLEEFITVTLVDEINSQKQSLEVQVNRNKLNQEQEKIKKIKFMKEKEALRKYQQEKKLKENQFQQEADLRRRCKELSDVQICLIIDTTHSMKPYFDSTLKCIKDCVQNINNKLNRQIQWAIVTYKDFDLNQPHLYHSFTKNYQELLNFSKLITCEGVGDTANDLDGAIQIALDQKKIKWNQAQKLCIIISDSPCHGKNFSTISSDDYPNADITPSLEKLIAQQIYLVGLKLNPLGCVDCLTTQMYAEFIKIYKQYNSEEYLLIFNIQRQQIQNLCKVLSDTISQAIIDVATSIMKTKNKYKHQMNVIKQTQINRQMIDEQHRNIDLKVIIIKLLPNIQDEIIQLKQPKTHLIQYIKDIMWQCQISQRPFISGVNKSLFCMRKQNDTNEFYLLKGQQNGQAYTTLSAAQQNCFSHLIAKYLLEQFKIQLQLKKKEYLDISYSDIWILKESSNQYWIAERYIEGVFQKYNNNFGYINESYSEINNFAQAFSYFTLFYCNCYQIVLNIQGADNYWTDPVINTRDGKYNDSDMGEEGLSMYLNNKEIDGFKNIGNKYKL